MPRIVQNIVELEAVIKGCKEAGVTSLEISGLKIRFKRTAKKNLPKIQIDEKKMEEVVSPPSFLDQVSPDEVLYYATPYYDELQAQKELHKQKLAEEGKENSDG